MFRVHCYTETNCEKFGLDFPENTYQTKSLSKVYETIENVFNNDDSGISKIVIEKDKFSICSCNPMYLD